MFALVKNNAFVKWINLSKDYPNTSFPSQIKSPDLPEDVVIVEDTNAPEIGVFEVIVRNESPIYSNGKWEVSYSKREMAQLEKDGAIRAESESVRNERNKKLADSDWTQLQDAPVNQSAWKTYRQSLRDITNQAGFPFSVQWPSSPE